VRLVRASLVAAALAALVFPFAARELARRRVQARLERLARGGPALCALDDAALSLRLERLGPLLASWETFGGCGAGGATGTGVKWIGHNTTGGLFSFQLMNNLVIIPHATGTPGGGGFNEIVNIQLGKDFIADPWRGAWNFSLSVPYLYKHYYSVAYLGGIPLTNAGIGDVNLFLSRKFGVDNSTSATVIAGVPTGSYTATYKTVSLTPDEQLGFGRVTATAQVEHTFDQDWGLMLVGGNAGYRGGKQTDKFLWFFDKRSGHYYRAPSASVYGYAGYFAGPLVPALGVNVTGYRRQDSRGDFTDTIDAPVATVAGHASLEWSNPYIAIMAGVYVPFALRGNNWARSPSEDGFQSLQPWTVAVGVSASPF
jgi:hypothetical protein